MWHMVSAQGFIKLSVMRLREAWRHLWTLDDWDWDVHIDIIIAADHTGRSPHIFYALLSSSH